jgi:FtsP/CotA-like multicopper oxidase with cupredoxin domain/fibronectin type 3 domain-containing protein
MLKQFAKRFSTARKNKSGRRRQHMPTWETLEDRVLLAVLPLGPLQGGTPDYYNTPNWANSPQPVVDATGAILPGTGIQKFVDSLAGLYFANADPTLDAANLAAADNNLGQYIPVAVADTTTYPGSDYYEIALVQYTEQMSSSLNPTTLRGYVQLETPVNASVSHHVALTYPDGTPILDSNGAQVYALNTPQYLGPTIVAAKDRPVRVKFTNYLPTGMGGDLFLPVDTTVMGSGTGPNMAMPMMASPVAPGSLLVDVMYPDPLPAGFTPFQPGEMVMLSGFTPDAYNGEFMVGQVADATHFQIMLRTDPGSAATVTGDVMAMYTQNRGTLHLHGGVTPWISDGTPHQWTTPAGESTSYPEGVSVQNVPDMPDPGPGSETFFYSNQQSARLMFYHDHSYGITRLNVYAGEAAGYLLTDAVEQDLIARGILSDVGIPLIIQDKTFLDTTQTDPNFVLNTDPTWPFAIDDALNNLWTPHVYMPNQNPNTLDGANPLGRWDYGPWFWPPWPTTNAPISGLGPITITDAGSGYTLAPIVTITPAAGDTTGTGATATAVIDPLTGAVMAINAGAVGTGYTLAPIVNITPAPGDITGTGATATATTWLYPNVPDLSMTMEAFQDTPVVNGTLYPYMDVQPQAYRFRILNAADDRSWNLQLYVASTIVQSITVTGGGSGYTNAPLVTITPATGDTTGMGATATATIDPVTGTVTAINLFTVGSEYTLPPLVTIAPPTTPGGITATATATIYTGTTEVGMVPAVQGAAAFPSAWTTQTIGVTGDILDNRSGGVPDPRTIGPSMVQIGTEGGFLPTPVIWDNIPIGYERNPKNVVVTNVAEHNLLIGPAERADVIIDFSQFAGKTVILYNDSPAPIPATDSRLDYYTDDVDQTASGGTFSTLPGYGPNTRTIMAFHVSATGVPTPFDLAALEDAFTTTTGPTGHPSVFVQDQDPIIVPQAAYDSAYGTTAFPSDTTAYERIQNNSLTFQPLDPSTPAVADQVATPVTIMNQPKAIQELFESDYGRMNATLGVELPFTNGTTQTTIPYGYIDPVTEILNDTPNASVTPIGSLADGTQLWKITHNGVDTHFIHFHLFNVQVIDRVGWDGQVKPPDANELGWKDTVRMNPLEDVIVAFRAVAPKLTFGVPDSVRPLDPTMPIGSTMGFSNVDPTTGNPVTTPVTNELYNFGWEYVWHCHILSHEEMDMMRPIQFNVASSLATAPVLSYTPGAAANDLFWTDPTPVSDPATLGNSANEIGFRIERADVDAQGNPGTYLTIGSALANATTFTDATVNPLLAYGYQVVAFNAAGDSASNAVLTAPLQTMSAPTSLTATLQAGPQVSLTWTDTAVDETGFVVQRSDNGGAFATIATPAANPGTGNVTYVDTTVQAGNAYVYQVCAVNGSLASAFSNTASVDVFVAPSAPTSLTAALQAGPQVSLTWTDTATNETGFVVQRSDNGGAFATIATPAANPGTGTVTYVDATVQFGNTYVYQVCAMNGPTASTFSNTATMILLSAPTGLTATLQIGPQVSLTWMDHATNETGFMVQRSDNGGAFATIATPVANPGTGHATYVDSTVQAGNTYVYQVSAVNGAFASAFSNTAGVNVPVAPAAPTSLTARLQARLGTAPQTVLTFRDNATNETGFLLERAVNGGSFALVATLPARNRTGNVTYTDTVAAGSTYAYRVRAVNGVVPSAYSNTVTLGVPNAPAAPLNFRGIATARSRTTARINLSWTDNSINETQFVIQRASAIDANGNLVNPTTFTVTRRASQSNAVGGVVTLTQNLQRATTYYYRILARNLYGDSVWVNLDIFPITTP